MNTKRSDDLFSRAQDLLVGGVNSPVRAFKAVGGAPHFIKKAAGPKIVDADGKTQEGAVEGNLIITDSWPGQMRTVYGDHKRFVETYFSTFDNAYTTGDGARRDWRDAGRRREALGIGGSRRRRVCHRGAPVLPMYGDRRPRVRAAAPRRPHPWGDVDATAPGSPWSR